MSLPYCIFIINLKGYKSRNDAMKWTSLETKSFFMSAQAFKILSCFWYYVSSQHHNYSSYFILSHLYVKINLRIFSLLFSYNTLKEHKHNFERGEKGLNLNKITSFWWLTLSLSVVLAVLSSGSVSSVSPACSWSHLSSDQTGLDDPSLIRCGFAILTRIVRPNNSESFWQ